MKNLNVIADGDSHTRGLQDYILLRSPKAGIVSRSKLPLMSFFFGAGLILGGTLSKIGVRMAPDSARLTKIAPNVTADTNFHVNNSAEEERDPGPLRTRASVDAPSASGDAEEEPLPSIDSDMVESTVGSVLRRQHNNDPLPVAWLMSFPNSGTSYTSYLVRVVTGTNTASNYGTVNVGKDGTSVVVFKDSPGGPFWSGPLSKKYVRPNSGYILTKTHCGGRCEQCPPEEYIENQNTFSRRCFEGYHISKGGNGERVEILGSYSKDLVAKAVHLIRDPFDNIVSRFHLSYKHFVKKNHTDKIAKYPRSKEGFRAFCFDLGDRFYKQEKADRFYRDFFDDVKNIPCHGDFFRYIQWHNLAFTTTWDLGVETMILHYENYTENFNQTKDQLLGFLKQDGINDPPHFETGKSYREYFTKKEIQAVSAMFSKLALYKTWDHIKHYFTH